MKIEKAKAFIWDLDCTLWDGVLAEGDQLRVFDNRVRYIKQLNALGVVNSICSKNDLEVAKTYMQGLGIWELFVFPRVKFQPKGEVLKKLVNEMRLRPEDVVFVDDNPANLREAEFYCTGIQTRLATDPCFDSAVEAFLESLPKNSKSRVREYQILERKYTESGGHTHNIEFLRSSDIKVKILSGGENLRFSTRLEELANRTNQLNYTKTRLGDGEIRDFILDLNYDVLSVFVSDKFGFYGLVGLVIVDLRAKKVIAFLFSCRVMDMKIEEFCANHVRRKYRGVELPIRPGNVDYIKLVDFDDTEFCKLIDTAFDINVDESIRIMANCQSGALAHYVGDLQISYDNYPRVFRLEDLQTGADTNFKILKKLVYGAFVDYDDRYWTAEVDSVMYKSCVDRFLEECDKYDIEAMVLLPPEKFRTGSTKLQKNGVSLERVVAFNSIWREAAAASGRLKIINMEDFIVDEAVPDPRHFPPSVLQRLAVVVREFIVGGIMSR